MKRRSSLRTWLLVLAGLAVIVVGGLAVWIVGPGPLAFAGGSRVALAD